MSTQQGSFRELKNRASGRLLRQLEVPSKTEHPQCVNSVPVEIEFVPGKAMMGRLGMCVMVDVPALTKSQESHPEIVFGRITGRKPLRSPHVGGRVHQPSGVQVCNSGLSPWAFSRFRLRTLQPRSRSP
jgi:hypothetical protein